jgi:hypothetical protein
VETLTPATLGLPAFLIFLGFSTFLGLLFKGAIVLGRECTSLEKQLADMRSDRDYWRLRVERGTALAEQATGIASRALPPVGGGTD